MEYLDKTLSKNWLILRILDIPKNTSSVFQRDIYKEYLVAAALSSGQLGGETPKDNVKNFTFDRIINWKYAFKNSFMKLTSKNTFSIQSKNIKPSRVRKFCKFLKSKIMIYNNCLKISFYHSKEK